jgi:hypothetical protein
MQTRTADCKSPPFKTAKLGYFDQKNPIIRIFCISGWLVVPINPEKWSSTVLGAKYVFVPLCPP